MNKRCSISFLEVRSDIAALLSIRRSNSMQQKNWGKYFVLTILFDSFGLIYYIMALGNLI